MSIRLLHGLVVAYGARDGQCREIECNGIDFSLLELFVLFGQQWSDCFVGCNESNKPLIALLKGFNKTLGECAISARPARRYVIYVSWCVQWVSERSNGCVHVISGNIWMSRFDIVLLPGTIRRLLVQYTRVAGWFWWLHSDGVRDHSARDDVGMWFRSSKATQLLPI
jgi:hypothetical protein